MLWPYMYHRTAYLSIVSIPSPCNTMFVSIRHVKGSFNNYVAKILPFFGHLPTYHYLDILKHECGQEWIFLDHLATSSCPRSYWTAPKVPIWDLNTPYLLHVICTPITACLYVCTCTLYYPYYVYSNSFVLYYILEQLLDPQDIISSCICIVY